MEKTKQILNKLELENALDFVNSKIQLFEIFGRYNNVSVSKLKIDLKKNFPKYSKYLYRYNNKFELFLGLLKQDKNLENLIEKGKNVIGKLKIKFILFFIINFIFILLFWYYLSCFSAVYKNSQYHSLKRNWTYFLR